MAEPEPGSAPPVLKDRSGLLLFFGVMEILLGAGIFSVGVAALVLVALEVVPLPPGQQISLLKIAARVVTAAFFVIMGIGTIRGRRWARAVMLVSSWYALVVGILGVAFMAWLVPAVASHSAQGTSPTDKGVLTAAVVVVLVIVGFVMLMIPGASILFYSGRNVRATFELKDPGPGWTDRCPMPVLALSLVMLGFAGTQLLTLQLGVHGFCGRVLTGIPAVSASLAEAAIWMALAWGIYRMHRLAWWAALIYVILTSTASWVSLRHASIEQLMARGGFNLQQLQAQGVLDAIGRLDFSSFTLVYAVAWAAALLYVRRHFVSAPARQHPSDGQTTG